MCFVNRSCGDSKCSASTSSASPEEVGVLASVSSDKASISSDDVDLEQVVYGQSVSGAVCTVTSAK